MNSKTTPRTPRSTPSWRGNRIVDIISNPQYQIIGDDEQLANALPELEGWAKTSPQVAIEIEPSVGTDPQRLILFNQAKPPLFIELEEIVPELSTPLFQDLGKLRLLVFDAAKTLAGIQKL